MSVYTVVGRDELAAWLQPLGLGALVEHVGIAAGMQNSNYFVTTATGRYVLTLFEQIDPAELDFYLALQAHLAAAGVPAPQPFADPAGRRWRMLCGKPAALCSCLPGKAVETPDVAQCGALGRALGQLHDAARDFPNPPPNPCGAAWRACVGARLLAVLDGDEARLLADELAYQAAQDWSALPRGVIHADLFRDNALWSADGQLSGVLDFYFAGEDALLFDLAVVVNDWCADDDRFRALLAGYTDGRPLTEAEIQAWPAVRRAAALRFWLLRLEALHMPRNGEVVTRKNPDEFRQRLVQIRLDPGQLTG